MINPQQLMEQFMGSSAQAQRKLEASGLGGFGGGAVAGGVLGFLLGNKKMRKMAGGVVGYGGAAAAGALALKAYQNWQQGQAAATAPVLTPAQFAQLDPQTFPDALPAANGQPFQLVMIRAMIAAAKADGHIDAAEQTRLFEQVEKMGLDAESKAFVFDALRQPVDIAALVASVRGMEQATELYLVSRMAIDLDHPAERAYLEALAHQLNLPADLIAHLEHQAAATGA